jgi:hypothetical protein
MLRFDSSPPHKQLSYRLWETIDLIYPVKAVIRPDISLSLTHKLKQENIMAQLLEDKRILLNILRDSETPEELHFFFGELQVINNKLKEAKV